MALLVTILTLGIGNWTATDFGHTRAPVPGSVYSALMSTWVLDRHHREHRAD